MKRVLVAGTADTKGEELAYLGSMIAEAGAAPVVVDVGIGEPRCVVDVTRRQVAAYASTPFLDSRDRGEASRRWARPSNASWQRPTRLTRSSALAALAIGEEDLAALRAIARSRTEPASRVERARMLLAYREDPSLFAVGRTMGVQHQTVQRCIERASACGARRSAAARQGAADHRGGQDMGCGSRLPQGQGTRLSSRIVDDATSRPPCAGARAGGGASLPRQTGSGHVVQHPQRAGDKAVQGPLLPGTPRPGVQAKDGGGSVRLSRGEAHQSDGGGRK
jgi:Uncharacterised protein family (UPF0261)